MAQRAGKLESKTEHFDSAILRLSNSEVLGFCGSGALATQPFLYLHPQFPIS
jgi:hypothetical protein